MKSSEQIGDFPHYEILRTLIEAAIRDQRAISASSAALTAAVAKIKDQVSTLPEQLSRTLAGPVEKNLIQHFLGTINAAQNATARFEQAASLSVRKLFLLPTVCFLAAVFGLLVYVKLAMPDPRQIQSLRLEEARLRHSIALLEREGGKAQITQCRERTKTRPCIRTDERYGVFGNDKDTFRIIYGY